MAQPATLLTVAASGVTTGTTFDVQRDTRSHMPVQVDITAGTATVVIEGRIDPSCQWIALFTTSTTDATSVLRMPQMRARLSAASAATVRAAIDADCR